MNFAYRFLKGCIALLFCSVSLFSQADLSDSLVFKPINKVMFWENKPASLIASQESISFSAGKNTDWFNSADGWLKVNSAPRLVFIADSEFIFSAKVNCPLNAKWDGAALVAEFDNEHWAKLCFEKDYQSSKRIVTVVNNVVSDDCNSEIIEMETVYLQIARKGNVLFFYYSQNGNDWYLVRNFSFPYQKVRIGFLVQSPAGDGNNASFSEINYKAIPMKDFWKGE